MNNNRPWYHDWKKEIDLAGKFFSKSRLFNRLDQPLKSELDAFYESSIGRVIYESNLIEDAGLSLSDTKKIVGENNNITDPKKQEHIFRKLEQELSKKYRKNNRNQGILSLSGKKRSTLEVYKHLMTILLAEIYVSAQKIGRQGKNDAPAGWWVKLYPELFISLQDFLSENVIKELHFIMAGAFIPRDAGVRAGFYRIDNRTTDFQTVFPSHENVPKAMENFIINSNKLINSEENPVIKAAKISYDFVAIHPFPDFNGRMSRLIMNMVLRREGLPFPVAIKGNRKEKHKYMTALRHANRGKITTYACLIAKAINSSFEELNANLKKSGQKPIIP